MAEQGLTSAESGCFLWTRSSKSQTPATALHRRQQIHQAHIKPATASASLPPPLTFVAGGYVDAFAGRLLVAERRHAVQRLDREGVRGVRQQAPHLHPATQQAVLRGAVADAISARKARPLGRPADGASDGVAQVFPAAAVHGLVPLQSEHGVVDPWVEVAWSGGRFYEDGEKSHFI